MKEEAGEGGSSIGAEAPLGTKSGFAMKRDRLGCFCFCGRKGEDK